MVQKDKLGGLKTQFQRIFTLPVTRTTFREISSAILTASNGDAKRANEFIEALIVNNPSKSGGDRETQEFIGQYSTPTRVAKEVHDRGNFLSMSTTDVGIRGETLIFSTSLRRTDGEDFHFVTDTVGILQLLDHFLVRLKESGKEEKGKENIKKAKEYIAKVGKHIEEISKF